MPLSGDVLAAARSASWMFWRGRSEQEVLRRLQARYPGLTGEQLGQAIGAGRFGAVTGRTISSLNPSRPLADVWTGGDLPSATAVLYWTAGMETPRGGMRYRTVRFEAGWHLRIEEVIGEMALLLAEILRRSPTLGRQVSFEPGGPIL